LQHNLDLNFPHPDADDKRNIIYLVSEVKEEEDQISVALPVIKTEVGVSDVLKFMLEILPI
jgi:hypothetical protein